MQHKTRAKGFTLIELMITIVIVSILATIALPSYFDSVRKTQRSDAKIKLSEIAQVLERCFTELNIYNYYVSATDRCPFISAGPAIAETSDEGYYTIAHTVLTGSTFSITATPVVGGPQAADAKCATFTLTHTGAKTATGTDAANCW